MVKDIFVEILKGLGRRTNKIQWNNLRNIKPVSRNFGFHRGTPIDRYYIENFLSQHRDYIKGRVLEISESVYSKKFGSNVTRYDVLHADTTHPHATINGDLSKPETLPENTFDCFICTQTLNFIYDFKNAIESSYRLMKPGGVMLTTVAGLCQISRYDMDRWGDYWRFTDLGLRKAFNEFYNVENVLIFVYGNVLSATCLLQGISADELTKDELDHRDQDYQVVIGVIAIK